MFAALVTWLESTALSTWVREAPWGFPIGLILHVWSLGFICGISLLLALAVFGRAPGLLPPLLPRFQPLVWSAFSISLASGLLLLLTYPDKVLTSKVFFMKLGFIAVALGCAVSLQRRLVGIEAPYTNFAPGLKWRAGGLLFFLFLAIVTGRLLYYTY